MNERIIMGILDFIISILIVISVIFNLQKSWVLWLSGALFVMGIYNMIDVYLESGK